MVLNNDKNIIELLGINPIDSYEIGEDYSCDCVDVRELEQKNNMSLAILVDTMIWFDTQLSLNKYTKEVKQQIRGQIEALDPEKRLWSEIKELLNE